ncbi:hypothetical protein B2J88_02930 [Rhodococcus sp. SRB_17]|nr:hypothetical protein [Rhodococcus sp. SRB_17]
MPDRELILGAYFTGSERVAWQHPQTCDLIDVNSIIDNAKIADDALFHFHFMAEALHVGEDNDTVAYHTVNGRHDVMTVHSALAGATKNLALISTINSTYHDPYDTARKLATSDLLSGGRVACNIVTSQLPATAANFVRGNHVSYAERYDRAEAFLDVVRGVWSGEAATAGFEHDSQTVGRIHGRGTWPAPIQRTGPLVLTANFSGPGAEFSAKHSDGVFMLPRTIEDARANYSAVKGKLAAYGRTVSDLKMIVGTDVVIGDTEAEAEEKFNYYLDLEITNHDVIVELEKIWMVDLSMIDPDGPLPSIEPDYEALGKFLENAPGVPVRDPHVLFAAFTSGTDGVSCREFVKSRFVRRAFVGTPVSVADSMQEWFETRATDGFLIQPHVVPLGLSEFTTSVVPILQERGLFRTENKHGSVRDSWTAA